MKKNKEMIYEVLKNALNVSESMVTNIIRTPSGETNDSYFVTVEDETYVVRLPGKGTEQLLDRRAEKQNLLFGTKLRINPPLIYYDDSNGIKITKAIKGAEPLLPQLAREKDYMQKVIHMFQRLHRAKAPMMKRFKLFPMMDHYEKIVHHENQMKLEQISLVRKDVHVLKRVYQSFPKKEVPCHMDAVYVNILKDSSNALYLIDWEYSGLFDPFWDLATLSMSLQLNKDEELFFLSYYLERQPKEEELQRLHLMKIFLDYYWSLWYFYKEAKGEKFGENGMNRIKRAEKHIEQYKERYEKNIVV